MFNKVKLLSFFLTLTAVDCLINFSAKVLKRKCNVVILNSNVFIQQIKVDRVNSNKQFLIVTVVLIWGVGRWVKLDKDVCTDFVTFK